MKRILLIHPPSPFLVDERSLLPLGAVTVATVLNKSQDYDASVIDLAGVHDYTERTLDCLGMDAWDAVGVSTTTQQTPRVTPLVQAIRKEFPRLHLVAGGAGPTNDPATYLRIGFDKVVRNEGEFAWNAWVPGGDPVITPPLLEDLDALPMADRDLVDVKSYTFKVRDRDGKPHPSTHIMSTRGCPFSCGHCCGREQEYYRRYRAFSPERVVRELRYIRDTWGFTAIQDYADEVNVDRKWLLEYCDRLKRENFVLRSFCVAKLFDDEVAKAMSEAGWTEVCFGVESGSAELLKRSAINKTTPEASLKAVRLAHKHGIRVKTFLMVGLPGETRETVEQTKQWLLSARPDDYDISIFTPMKGSPIFDHPERFKDSISFTPIDFASDESFYKGRPGGGYQAKVSTPGLTQAELVALRDEVDFEVRKALGIPHYSGGVPFEHSMGQPG